VLVSRRPTLLFVSTQFLFPLNTGGKIRTTQVLRGMKGGQFRIVLATPASSELLAAHAGELESVADEVVWWPQPARSPAFRYTRLRYLLDPLPIPIRTDVDDGAAQVVSAALAQRPDVVVFDFLHAAVLAPANLPVPSVLFTHNVEAEVFRRHAEVATNPLMRAIWNSQYRKMTAFERNSVRRFDRIVVVAERDKEQLAAHCDAARIHVIPTGVDLDYFDFRGSGAKKQVVFTGSMDWLANIDAMSYFLDEVWPLVIQSEADARMVVVGRNPPQNLIARAAARGYAWQFTGLVDDVRPYVAGSSAFVIPLRVGGGTRLKVYEALAMGSPLVSTTIGVEGLPLTPGEHYLLADDAKGLAAHTVRLLREPQAGRQLARHAREFVEAHFSFVKAARVFEQACVAAMQSRASHAAASVA
jgi:glycosyltransferase involved in cell wall biosynthesis